MCQQGNLGRGMSTGNILLCWSQHPESPWGWREKTIRKKASWQGWEHRNNITGKYSMDKNRWGNRHKVGQQANWTSHFLIARSLWLCKFFQNITSSVLIIPRVQRSYFRSSYPFAYCKIYLYSALVVLTVIPQFSTYYFNFIIVLLTSFKTTWGREYAFTVL